MSGAQSLLAAISAGLAAPSEAPLTERLAAVDEMHLGGKAGTDRAIGALAIRGGRHLDIGCGLGGPARRVAAATGAEVAGIDLDPLLIEAGQSLNRMTTMDGKVKLSLGDALNLDFATGEFDSASLLHVGMNIADKDALFAGVARVLRPGGRFVVYDVMRVGAGAFDHPLPWASRASQSHVVSPDTYEAALIRAGFRLESRATLLELALKGLALAIRLAEERPPLGLHLVLGEDAALRMTNLAAAVSAGTLAPVMMVAVRA